MGTTSGTLRSGGGGSDVIDISLSSALGLVVGRLREEAACCPWFISVVLSARQAHGVHGCLSFPVVPGDFARLQ
jgi:hypothetical protein